jgi:hypothetical protein
MKNFYESLFASSVQAFFICSFAFFFTILSFVNALGRCKTQRP